MFKAILRRNYDEEMFTGASLEDVVVRAMASHREQGFAAYWTLTVTEDGKEVPYAEYQAYIGERLVKVTSRATGRSWMRPYISADGTIMVGSRTATDTVAQRMASHRAAYMASHPASYSECVCGGRIEDDHYGLCSSCMVKP